MIVLDGSFGEGGGQILRTALSLPLVTGKPFRMEKIRAGRERPGLLRQHLAAVTAAAQVGEAAADGAYLGSTALTFTPATIKPGRYHFAVGTAGSATLVFQTILPALMTASELSQITLEGGTHNQAAPPFDYLARTFLPVLEKMGAKVGVRLEKYGFYPAGGGRFVAEIEPCRALTPIHLDARARTSAAKVQAIVANLPRSIAQRECDTAARLLSLDSEQLQIVETRNSPGPGNVVMIEIASEKVVEIVTAFGKMGVSAEKVATEAANQPRDYLASEAAVGEHLADQLLLPMALAGQGSFTTRTVSSHCRTNAAVIAKFLPLAFDFETHASFSRIAVRPNPA
jgi:RNA 3'-terminal phosphate cyclase (ATP)